MKVLSKPWFQVVWGRRREEFLLYKYTEGSAIACPPGRPVGPMSVGRRAQAQHILTTCAVHRGHHHSERPKQTYDTQ